MRAHLGATKRALEALNLVLVAGVFLQWNTPVAGDFHPPVHGMVKVCKKLVLAVAGDEHPIRLVDPELPTHS